MLLKMVMMRMLIGNMRRPLSTPTMISCQVIRNDPGGGPKNTQLRRNTDKYGENKSRDTSSRTDDVTSYLKIVFSDCEYVVEGIAAYTHMLI